MDRFGTRPIDIAGLFHDMINPSLSLWAPIEIPFAP